MLRCGTDNKSLSFGLDQKPGNHRRFGDNDKTISVIISSFIIIIKIMLEVPLIARKISQN